MIAAAAMPWKSACGRVPSRRSGSAGPCSRPAIGVRQEGHEGEGADHDERGRLADGPGHRQDDAGHDPRRRGREDGARTICQRVAPRA